MKIIVLIAASAVLISDLVLQCHTIHLKPQNFKKLHLNKDKILRKSMTAKTACTFMSMTPGRDPMRCSMDWTQEPQVIPSTPRETEHRLSFCVMTALSKKTRMTGCFYSNTQLQVFDFKTIKESIKTSRRKGGKTDLPKWKSN